MKDAIKNIMVPLDSSEYCAAAISRACDIAKHHGATLTGLAILDLPGIYSQIPTADMYIPTTNGQIAEKLTESAEAQLLVARHQFCEICDRAGVEYTNPKVEGVPAELVLDAAKLHDLVVMGQRTFFDYTSLPSIGNPLADLLNRTVTPILAVPKQDVNRPLFRAIVAYDGSMNAARTLRDFVGFAEPLDLNITILTADDNTQRAEWNLAEAENYIKSHGLKHYETLHRKERQISSDIIDHYDIVVAGIHSKRYFKALNVGGFTRTLLDRDDKALFLSH